VGILVAYPALAVLPALGFLALFLAARQRLVLVAAAAWAAYTVYEFAMKARWLCSGECDIRVDLLLLYPLLLVLSGAAVIAAARGRRGRGPTTTRTPGAS